MATAVTHPASLETAVYRSPLALWHLLSLDAPTVACVWVLFFAHAWLVRLGFDVPASLGVAVWLLYVGDRINDALRGGLLEERHRFHLRHHTFLIAGMVGAALLLFFLVLHLPHRVREAWLLLSLPLLIYVLLVHGLCLPRFPKEATVGVFFGCVVPLPTILAGHVALRFVLPCCALFAGLCWLNGIAIARWEHASPRNTDRYTCLLSRKPYILGCALVSVAVLLLAVPQCRAISMAVLVSAILLLLLESAHTALSRVHVRALADAALLTPLLVWPFVPAMMR